MWLRILVIAGCGWALWIAFSFTPEATPQNLVCVIKSATGFDCPACGITRGLTALAHGRFKDAFLYFPFVYPVFLGIIIALIGAFLPGSLWEKIMHNPWITWTIGLGAGLTGAGILGLWVVKTARVLL